MHQTCMFVVLTTLVTLHEAQETKQTIRARRSSSVRAALAEKLEPNFWPARGRRNINNLPNLTDWLKTHRFNPTAGKQEAEEKETRASSSEDGPFWANRGRSTSEDGPFWANRGRSTDEDGPFWANRGRSTGEDGPFWANRGRSTGEDGPFWANRGRSTDEDGPFWANRGRSADFEFKDYDEPLLEQSRGLTSGEDGPFWANRGRRRLSEEMRWREQPLYVEEPGFILLTRREATGPGNDDPFWVARGKRSVSRKKRRSSGHVWAPYGKKNTDSVVRALADPFWPVRGKRYGTKSDKPESRALDKLKQDLFWPVRGKKENEI